MRWFCNGESIRVYDSLAESSNALVISPGQRRRLRVLTAWLSAAAGGATPTQPMPCWKSKPLAGSQLFFGGFEGVPWAPNVDEAGQVRPSGPTPCPMAGLETTWTHPVWMTMTSECAMEGGEFATQKEGSGRSSAATEFTKGTGTVAIADGDEWDDKGESCRL